MITNLKQVSSSEKEGKEVISQRRFEVNHLKRLQTLERAHAAGGWEFYSVLDELPFLQERVFSHVSHRLLQKHDFWNIRGEIRLTLFVDFLLQARELYIKSREYNGCTPSVVSGVVVFPDNMKDEIVISPNDSGKLTIKLASDA